MAHTTNGVFAGTYPTGGTTSVSSYAYDAAGCLTNLNGVSLEWDERYRLVGVDDASSFVEYEYDVLGRKTARTKGSSVEYYVYDGPHIVADLDADKNLLRTYVYGPGIDNILTMTRYSSGNNPVATYQYIKDHQNTVIALADENGTVVESYEYDACGNILDVKDASGNSIANQQSAIGNRYTFQGREIDWTTGLIYFRARWYDAETGRWLSKDPIGISGGLNLYAFCGNNPVNFIDPTGLCKEEPSWWEKTWDKTKKGAEQAKQAGRFVLDYLSTVISNLRMPGAGGPMMTITGGAITGAEYSNAMMNYVYSNGTQRALMQLGEESENYNYSIE